MNPNLVTGLDHRIDCGDLSELDDARERVLDSSCCRSDHRVDSGDKGAVCQ